MLRDIILSIVVVLSVVVLSDNAEYCIVECYHAKRFHAKYCCTECRHAGVTMLIAIMLIAVMLIAGMLTVLMLKAILLIITT
jgi:hypothetical protein